MLVACEPTAPPTASAPGPNLASNAAVNAIAEHPNGLRLALPAGFKATPQPEGFIVEEDPLVERRMALRISVRLLPSTGPLPGPGRRTLSPGREFGWSLRSSDSGGSGGPEHMLTACETIAGQRVLCLAQTKLGKHGAPDFELWQVAAGASVQPRGQ